MKNIIRIILLILALTITTCGAYAQSTRYSNILKFRLTGNIKSTSVSSTVVVALNDNLDSKTVITLERSSNGGSSFHTYQTLKSETSSSSNYQVQASKSGLSSAYDYRIKAELYVYDELGSEIEYDYTYLE